MFTWNRVAEAFPGDSGSCRCAPNRMPAADGCGAAEGTKHGAEGTDKPSSLVLLHCPISPLLVRCLRGDSGMDFSQEGSSHHYCEACAQAASMAGRQQVIPARGGGLLCRAPARGQQHRLISLDMRLVNWTSPRMLLCFPCRRCLLEQLYPRSPALPSLVVGPPGAVEAGSFPCTGGV